MQIWLLEIMYSHSCWSAHSGFSSSITSVLVNQLCEVE